MIERQRHRINDPEPTGNGIDASSPLPLKLAELERRISAALTGDRSATDLADLLEQTDWAVIAAEEFAKDEREKALDPLASPDPHAARQCAEDAQFMVGRLKTLRPRLLQRHREISAREQLAQWQTHAHTLAGEGEQLAADLALYAEVTPKLVDVFGRLAVYRQKHSALYADRPPGVDDIAADPELQARHLQHFSRDCPTLLDSVQLRDWQSGKEVWPQRSSAQFAATFAQSMTAHSYYAGADWWRLEEQKAAERRAEMERMNRHYEQMTHEQEQRINKEERESFLARQRA